METALNPVLLGNSSAYFPSVNVSLVDEQKEKIKWSEKKEAYENVQQN